MTYEEWLYISPEDEVIISDGIEAIRNIFNKDNKNGDIK